MNRICPTVREGTLYEELFVDGRIFEVCYGFYEDYERDGSEPIPIYPDLAKEPLYGDSGKRIVTFMQEPCFHFRPKEADVERCCGCCGFYPDNRQMINACTCIKNNLKILPERLTIISQAPITGCCRKSYYRRNGITSRASRTAL